MMNQRVTEDDLRELLKDFLREGLREEANLCIAALNGDQAGWDECVRRILQAEEEMMGVCTS